MINLILCNLWWLLLGGLLGWLASWLLGRPRFTGGTVASTPGIDHATAKAAGYVVSGTDNLEIIEGVGPKIAHLLRSNGVGTFALAAALLSERLRQFHCTDVFLIEHLNPTMLDTDRVNVEMLRLPGYVDAWQRSSNRLDLLLHWRPPTGAGARSALSAAPDAADPP
jgi:hypothetical protein